MRKLLRSGTDTAPPKSLFPPGYFYSPIVDVAELRESEARVFAAHAEALREALGEPGGAYYGGGSLWIEKIA